MLLRQSAALAALQPLQVLRFFIALLAFASPQRWQVT